MSLSKKTLPGQNVMLCSESDYQLLRIEPAKLATTWKLYSIADVF